MTIDVHKVNKSPRPRVSIIEENPVAGDFLGDVLSGLSQKIKSIDPVYFYDKIGSDLFYKICETEDYYPTRTEATIFARYSKDICKHLPMGSLVVELGGGGSRKIDALLKQGRVGTYVPTDVSKEHLITTAEAISRDFVDIDLACVVGDYMVHDLPQTLKKHRHRTVFFPGSTLGNLDVKSRFDLMTKVKAFVGQGMFLVGIDLVKDIGVLERAYNDSEGLSRLFNLNLLARMNRELGGDFDLDAFAHRAFFNVGKSRIEMHLESLVEQHARVADRTFSFKKGETIHTENSYKFSLAEFVKLANVVGFELVDSWRDDSNYFAEVLLRGV